MLNHKMWRRGRATRNDTQRLQENVRRSRLASCTAAALAIAGSYYAAPSYAQNITGGLHGTATPGATIVVTSPSQGFQQDVGGRPQG